MLDYFKIINCAINCLANYFIIYLNKYLHFLSVLLKQKTHVRASFLVVYI